MALTGGARLGAFHIVALIGEGGMGQVYRAVDVRLKRSVAIKVLPAEVAGDAARLARFQREAEALARLNHPNIAQIHGLETSDDTSALVMELVEGPTLADRIAQGPLPIDEALPIARQVAEALEAAHAQGIVHRDLKPANIKVRPDGTVKVLDFGLAKAIEPVDRGSPAESPTLTTPGQTIPGMILGTAAYMSPEQARGRPVDKRIDVWAFGCLLYEMLSGRRVFEAEGIPDTIAAVLRADPDWSLLPPLPESLHRLLRRCLQKDPRHRLRDLGDAQLDLEDAGAASRSDASAAKPVAGRGRALGGAIALAILFAGLAVAAAIYSRAPARAPEMRVEIGTPRAAEPWWFAVSPDGRRMAFVAERDGESVLWMRALDQGDAQPLAGTEGARYPFWSPDGSALAFFGINGEIKRIEPRGGPAQTVAPSTGPSPADSDPLPELLGRGMIRSSWAIDLMS